MSIAAKEMTIVPESNNALTPMDMLNRAVQSGASMETLEKLMGLQERWEKNQAKKSFDAAISAAKSEIPVIIKNREVDFTSPKGRTHYRHEDMAGIARVVDPILSKHGLSYRYRTNVGDGGLVTVTCIISHRDGHSEENSLSAGRDETGNKNNIQGVGSTITYLQRYTLKAALGLAASSDNDGASPKETGPISEAQLSTLRKAMEVKECTKERLLKWARAALKQDIDDISELPAFAFDKALAKIRSL